MRKDDFGFGETSKEEFKPNPNGKTHYERTGESIKEFEERKRAAMTYQRALEIRSLLIEAEREGLGWSQELVVESSIADEFLKNKTYATQDEDVERKKRLQEVRAKIAAM